MSNIRNVGDLLDHAHDERSRQSFVSAFRKRILMDVATDMKTVYDKKVEPKFVKKHGRKPKDALEVRAAMRREPVFEGWSSMRYNAQIMTWWSVQPAVERQLNELIQAARDARDANPAGGTLELDPNVVIPREVTDLDVHHMPGCFHTEYAADDVAQGAVYHYGTQVFYGGFGKDVKPKGDVAMSIANYLKLAYPDLKPQRILDLGCTAGANTFPYKQVYPDAEVHGIDVGAPVLRFGHAWAEAEGIQMHYHQRNAETPGFPDNHFDIITSSFFFHELAVPTTKRVLKECYRMLKPGGIMLHMELPPTEVTETYYNFVLDWDGFYNNEPHYQKFRNLDFTKTLVGAGFAEDKLEMIRIPNYGSTPREEFTAVAQGDATLKREHGLGRVWFTFGGRK